MRPQCKKTVLPEAAGPFSPDVGSLGFVPLDGMGVLLCSGSNMRWRSRRRVSPASAAARWLPARAMQRPTACCSPLSAPPLPRQARWEGEAACGGSLHRSLAGRQLRATASDAYVSIYGLAYFSQTNNPSVYFNPV